MMDTRRILVFVSVLGVAATLIAVMEGAWIYGLVLYGVCVLGLGLLLRRAVRKHRGQADQAVRTALNETPPNAGVPPTAMSPHS